MRSVRMNVQGRVQGVGFRYLTKMVADRLGVFGKVWNEADGSVTIEAQGSEAIMADFIAAIRKSPAPQGKVTSLTLQEIPSFCADSFQVTYR